jgi:FkbM family methyltransferase
VGVYSLYAALRPGVHVTAFEPAAVNYFLLSANCEANDLQDRVDCLLIGLGAARGIARLEVSQFEAAHSFSFRGKSRQPRVGRQAALIESMDALVEDYGLPCPTHLKLDVPGMTDDIFAGASRTLRRQELLELHIELNLESKAGQRLSALLNASGFGVKDTSGQGGGADVTFVRR